MSTLACRLIAGGAALCASLGLLVLFTPTGEARLGAAEPAGAAAAAPAEPEPAPPANQEYTGAKRCASCHFEEYMQWSKTAHAKAFELLPAQYQKNPECVKCHVTGFGEPSGFKDVATTAALKGITCESCHGPGSEHERVSKPFLNVKKLSPEQEKITRDSIWLMKPQAVCINCHATQAHKPSMTPPELRKKP